VWSDSVPRNARKTEIPLVLCAVFWYIMMHEHLCWYVSTETETAIAVVGRRYSWLGQVPGCTPDAAGGLVSGSEGWGSRGRDSAGGERPGSGEGMLPLLGERARDGRDDLGVDARGRGEVAGRPRSRPDRSGHDDVHVPAPEGDDGLGHGQQSPGRSAAAFGSGCVSWRRDAGAFVQSRVGTAAEGVRQERTSQAAPYRREGELRVDSRHPAGDDAAGSLRPQDATAARVRPSRSTGCC